MEKEDMKMPEQRSRPRDSRVIALANQKGGITVLEIQYLIRYLLFLLIQLFLTNKLSVNLIQLWLVLVFSVQV